MQMGLAVVTLIISVPMVSATNNHRAENQRHSRLHDLDGQCLAYESCTKLLNLDLEPLLLRPDSEFRFSLSARCRYGGGEFC